MNNVNEGNANMNDGVLKTTRMFLTFLVWVITVAFAIMALVLVGMVVVGIADGNSLSEALQEQFPGIGNVVAILVGAAVASAAAAALWLIRKFLLLLRTIVDTVRSGDPFIRDNAQRLRSMGWLLVIVTVIKVFIAGMIAWTAQYADPSELEARVSGGIEFGGLLSILLLFVLAKVFERGADMREELEGTV